MKKLHIASDLALPIEVVTEKVAFLGRTGSGKTYAAQKLAELMHAAGAQFVALDPVGKWWSLRLAADEKSPGISLPVFGGLQGDVPLEPAAGKLIADVIVDRGISAVVDVSQFESDADKARFATDFGARLFYRKKAAPSALHIFVEEAQEFLPQNPMGEESRMLHVWTRIQKLGRNFGIGTSLLSQRPQEVNKKVLNQTELLFVFQLTGPQERKTIANWIEEKGIDEDIAGDLPKLKRGSPHVWSPAWLNISRVITIAPKWTFDASSTPRVGASAAVKALAPIDIEQLGKEISASKAKAEAEDPKRLRQEIGTLRAQLTKAEKAGPVRTVEKAVADPRAVERAVKDALTKWKAELDRRLTEVSASLRGQARDLRDRASQLETDSASSLRGLLAKIDVPVFLERPAERFVPTPQNTRPAPAPRPRVGSDYQIADESLGRGQQKILDAMAELEALGISPATRAQAGAIAGYTLSGGAGGNYVGQLVTRGLLEITAPGELCLTDDGRQRAAVADAPLTNEEAQQRAMKKLGSGERKILEYLISIWPNSATRAEAGEAVGYILSGGTGGNYVGRLTTLNFAEIPKQGHLRASDILFPEEARRA